jgi:hypothetical protein
MMLAITVSGCGRDDRGARVRAFARLPDWNGIWIADDGVMSDLELSGFPRHFDPSKHVLSGKAPYRPAWEQNVAVFRASVPPGRKDCGFYFPMVMESPWSFQFLITPEETALIFGGREIRHVYTDGRKHLDENTIWATPWGDSVGRWQGDTLVIDTIAVQSFPIPLGPHLSEQAHFTERIRMTAPGRMEDQITIEDTLALTRAWRRTVPYKRVTSSDRLVHGDCLENDRNPVVDGRLTIGPSH